MSDRHNGYAYAVARRVQELSLGRELWPGFDPLQIPLAIYDGTYTMLFRHPGTPEGFVRVDGADDAPLAFAGRHPRVVANTAADIEGVLVATLIVDEARGSADDWAAVAIHESFHVFQQQDAARWRPANEAVAFLYPLDNADLFAWRRQEVEALRRALQSDGVAEKIGWASRALTIREHRFSRMHQQFADYERGIELMEGTAFYVEGLAAGKDVVTLPVNGFGPSALRRSCYTTGHAFVLLLNEINPNWQLESDRHVEPLLDVRLAAALRERHGQSAERHFSAGEQATFAALAAQDVKEVMKGRHELAQQFDSRPGQRIVVETAAGRPLLPDGFDPMNVHVLHEGVLHTRLLHLRNDGNRIEMLRDGDADVAARTTAVGPHPLFDGVRRVEYVGSGDIVIEEQSGTVTIRCPGVKATLTNATVAGEDGVVKVCLAGASGPMDQRGSGGLASRRAAKNWGVSSVFLC